MKNIRIVFAIFLILSGCAKEQAPESFYITKCGGRTLNIPDLVITNNENSHFENLMIMGEPIKCKITMAELERLRVNIKNSAYFKRHETVQGITIGHYVNNNIVDHYIFEEGKPMDEIMSIFKKSIDNDQEKGKICDWFRAIREYYKK